MRSLAAVGEGAGMKSIRVAYKYWGWRRLINRGISWYFIFLYHKFLDFMDIWYSFWNQTRTSRRSSEITSLYIYYTHTHITIQMCSPYLAFTANDRLWPGTKEPIHQQPRNGSGWSLGTAERKYWFNQIRVTEPGLIKDMRRVPGMTISR